MSEISKVKTQMIQWLKDTFSYTKTESKQMVDQNLVKKEFYCLERKGSFEFFEMRGDKLVHINPYYDEDEES